MGQSVCVPVLDVGCARSRGTQELCDSGAAAGSKELVMLPAGEFTQHSPSSGMGSRSTPELPQQNAPPKCSNDGEGCQALGTTAATKKKPLPSEVINHPWCLGVNAQISQPCLS